MLGRTASARCSNKVKYLRSDCPEFEVGAESNGEDKKAKAEYFLFEEWMAACARNLRRFTKSSERSPSRGPRSHLSVNFEWVLEKEGGGLFSAVHSGMGNHGRRPEEPTISAKSLLGSTERPFVSVKSRLGIAKWPLGVARLRFGVRTTTTQHHEIAFPRGEIVFGGGENDARPSQPSAGWGVRIGLYGKIVCTQSAALFLPTITKRSEWQN